MRSYLPYLFLFLGFSAVAVWSGYYVVPVKTVTSRSIASDCNSIVTEIIATPKKKVTPNQSAHDFLSKFKTSIWNRIISNKDFENFNELEYFRWLEIYKDASSEFKDVNPVSIEQKMALIEVINGRLIPNALKNDQNFSNDVEKLGTYKMKKLQYLMKNFDLSSKFTRHDLLDFTHNLMYILKGPPSSLLDYFTKNKSARINDRIMRMVQEDVLLIGLKGMVERIPDKGEYTRLQNYIYKVQHFFKAKWWKYLTLPYDLPWFEKLEIPDELLTKIMIDGLAEHEQELLVYFKKQNKIDQYERFRKAYRPVAFSVGFYFYYEKWRKERKGELSENQEKEKQLFLSNIQNLSDAVLANTDPDLKSVDMLKEEHFHRLVKKFKEQNKAEPTLEEVEEIRARVYR